MKRSQSWLIIFVICLSCLSLSLPALASNGDRVQIGNDILIPKDQFIDGDSVVVFGEQKILGTVNGSVVSVFGDLEISGTVLENAVSVFGKIILRDGASVNGNLVSVVGTVERTGKAFTAGEVMVLGPNALFKDFFKGFPVNFIGWGINSWLPQIFVSILLTVILIYFMLPKLERIYQVIEAEPGKMALNGLFLTIGLGIICFILMITILGIPVALILALVGLIANIVGSVALYLLIGKRVGAELKIKTTPYTAGMIGATLISLAAMLPFAGGLIKLALGILGIGGVFHTRFGTRKGA